MDAGSPYKGAVALEMRLPCRARATKDIDLVIDGADEEDLAAVLREALENNYQAFSFRVKGDPYGRCQGSCRMS